ETDTMEIAADLVKLARRHGRMDAARDRRPQWEQDIARAPLIVDVGGLGLPMADRMSELGVSPTRFNGANRARRDEKYANRRAEAYMELRKGLERGTLALPPSETLNEELLAHSFGLDGRDRILIASKKDVKA